MTPGNPLPQPLLQHNHFLSAFLMYGPQPQLSMDNVIAYAQHGKTIHTLRQLSALHSFLTCSQLNLGFIPIHRNLLEKLLQCPHWFDIVIKYPARLRHAGAYALAIVFITGKSYGKINVLVV